MFRGTPTLFAQKSPHALQRVLGPAGPRRIIGVDFELVPQCVHLIRRPTIKMDKKSILRTEVKIQKMYNKAKRQRLQLEKESISKSTRSLWLFQIQGKLQAQKNVVYFRVKQKVNLFM